jgi:uncharacterized Zn-binding protein involved in type VI secretion
MRLLVSLLLFCVSAPAFSKETSTSQQNAPGNPPVVCAALMGGSDTVAVEGRQAGTVGALGCLKPLDASSNVFVNDRPVLRVGDRVLCPDGRVGVITGGASSVLVNGRPAATAASRVVGCE